MMYSENAAELLQGAIDVHVHVNPSFFPRALNGLELARYTLEAGMAGAMIKGHYGNTSGEAALATMSVQGRVQIFGSVVLNTFVGGINPAAVEAGAKLGAKKISMPTISAQNHIRTFNGPGFAAMSSDGLPRAPKTPLTVLDDAGSLIKVVYEVFDLVKEYDMVLATGHLSNAEGMLVCREAKRYGVRKVVFTHPDFRTNCLNMPSRRELASIGVLLERTGIDFTPAEVAWSIRELGVEHWFLATDFGQPDNPLPHIGLGNMIDALLKQGITKDEIRTMVRDTPRYLMNT